jgi:hypothetical protein
MRTIVRTWNDDHQQVFADRGLANSDIANGVRDAPGDLLRSRTSLPLNADQSTELFALLSRDPGSDRRSNAMIGPVSKKPVEE